MQNLEHHTGIGIMCMLNSQLVHASMLDGDSLMESTSHTDGDDASLLGCIMPFTLILVPVLD